MIIEDGAKVKNSIIWGNTKIGGDTVIKDSIVTGDMNIMSGTVIKKIITKDGIFDLKI